MCVVRAFFYWKRAAVCPLTCCRSVAVARPWAEQCRERHSSAWCELEKVLSLRAFLQSMTLSLIQIDGMFWTCSHDLSISIILLLPVDYCCGYVSFVSLPSSMPASTWISANTDEKKVLQKIKAFIYYCYWQFFSMYKVIVQNLHLKNTAKEVPWHNDLDGSALLVPTSWSSWHKQMDWKPNFEMQPGYW